MKHKITKFDTYWLGYQVSYTRDKCDAWHHMGWYWTEWSAKRAALKHQKVHTVIAQEIIE